MIRAVAGSSCLPPVARHGMARGAERCHRQSLNRQHPQASSGSQRGHSQAVSTTDSGYDTAISSSKLEELVNEAAEAGAWNEEDNQFVIIDLASIRGTTQEAEEMLIETTGYSLQHRHKLVANALDVALGTGGVRSCQPHGGTHCWIDLRNFLEWNEFESEAMLFWDFHDSYGLLLAPGGACGCTEPGWFRMHVANVPEDMLAAGFDRMERCLKSKVVLHGNWYQ